MSHFMLVFLGDLYLLTSVVVVIYVEVNVYDIVVITLKMTDN